MREQTVVLYSGGLDSTVLLYHKQAEGREVHALAVSYGQRHGREIVAAEAICKMSGIHFQVADIPAVGSILRSALTDTSIDVPQGHYEDESMRATVVPNRNMIMLAIATGHAASIGAREVAYAAHAGDHAIYPDCRPGFYHAMRRAIAVCHWDVIDLDDPFIGMTKAEIVQRGDKLGVPFQYTWSCYQGGETHCGVCGTCVERREAFAVAGVPDPTVYAT